MLAPTSSEGTRPPFGPMPSDSGLYSPRAAIKLRVEEQAQPLTVLVPRQEMTRADRQSAAQYESGDIVRYTRGSQAVGTADWVTAWVTTLGLRPLVVRIRACYPAPMSKCDNRKDEILRQLAENAKPVAEITSYSIDRGIYGFFLRKGCLSVRGQKSAAGNGALLYLGKTESSQKVRDAGQHLADGGTGHSTLRRSLGALLREQLNLKPQPRSDSETSTRRFTNFKFDAAGEERLTAWMKNHLSLGFCELTELTITELRACEKGLIKPAKPALNIVHNPEGPYRAELKSARGECVRLAREWAGRD